MADYNQNYINKKTYFVIGCKAIVLNNENNILVMRRTDKSGFGGKWSLPGGAVEDNENPADGIVREIDEECHMAVSGLNVFHIKNYKNNSGDNVIIIGYTCKTTSGEVTLNWEHDQFLWLSKQEALKLDLTPDGRTFLEEYY